MNYLILFLTIFSLIACSIKQEGGTTTGNPVAIDLLVTSSAQVANVAKIEKFKILPALFLPKSQALTPPSMQDASGATVTLTDAWIVIKNIEIRGEEVGAISEPSYVQYYGPYAIDLLSNTPSSLGTTAIYPPIRRFKAVLHKMDFTLPSGAPTGLTNHSIYLAGTVGGRSFIMRSQEGITYEVAGSNPVSPNSGAFMLLSLQTANLFKRIDLTNLPNGTTVDDSNKVAATNPCPNISASASDLYTCFKDGLKSEANFGEDKGNDHELDAGDNTVK